MILLDKRQACIALLQTYYSNAQISTLSTIGIFAPSKALFTSSVALYVRQQ